MLEVYSMNKNNETYPQTFTNDVELQTLAENLVLRKVLFSRFMNVMMNFGSRARETMLHLFNKRSTFYCQICNAAYGKIG